MALDEQLHGRIKKIIEDNRIVLFMKGSKHFPQCGFSAAVVEVLRELGADFHTVDVLSDPAIRQGIKEFANWPTIPQLYVNGNFIGGSDIVRDMYESGELEPVIRDAGSAPATGNEGDRT